MDGCLFFLMVMVSKVVMSDGGDLLRKTYKMQRLNRKEASSTIPITSKEKELKGNSSKEEKKKSGTPQIDSIAC